MYLKLHSFSLKRRKFNKHITHGMVEKAWDRKDSDRFAATHRPPAG